MACLRAGIKPEDIPYAENEVQNEKFEGFVKNTLVGDLSTDTCLKMGAFFRGEKKVFFIFSFLTAVLLFLLLFVIGCGKLLSFSCSPKRRSLTDETQIVHKKKVYIGVALLVVSFALITMGTVDYFDGKSMVEERADNADEMIQVLAKEMGNFTVQLQTGIDCILQKYSQELPKIIEKESKNISQIIYDKELEPLNKIADEVRKNEKKLGKYEAILKLETAKLNGAATQPLQNELQSKVLKPLSDFTSSLKKVTKKIDEITKNMKTNNTKTKPGDYDKVLREARDDLRKKLRLISNSMQNMGKSTGAKIKNSMTTTMKSVFTWMIIPFILAWIILLFAVLAAIRLIVAFVKPQLPADISCSVISFGGFFSWLGSAPMYISASLVFMTVVIATAFILAMFRHQTIFYALPEEDTTIKLDVGGVPVSIVGMEVLSAAKAGKNWFEPLHFDIILDAVFDKVSVEKVIEDEMVDGLDPSKWDKDLKAYDKDMGQSNKNLTAFENSSQQVLTMFKQYSGKVPADTEKTIEDSIKNSLKLGKTLTDDLTKGKQLLDDKKTDLANSDRRRSSAQNLIQKYDINDNVENEKQKIAVDLKEVLPEGTGFYIFISRLGERVGSEIFRPLHYLFLGLFEIALAATLMIFPMFTTTRYLYMKKGSTMEKTGQSKEKDEDEDGENSKKTAKKDGEGDSNKLLKEKPNQNDPAAEPLLESQQLKGGAGAAAAAAEKAKTQVNELNPMQSQKKQSKEKPTPSPAEPAKMKPVEPGAEKSDANPSKSLVFQ
ncbi:unnamed protein product [Caenorhabditis auriculariae]|uniref:Uncharacterized protein n=1 Tax=Caenorhabditis auriculariae TaxID=2777116 RepID=A0A8S1HBZ2_9PELO|nr:unnamed protein product [Caenorhabditis auriculariae]